MARRIVFSEQRSSEATSLTVKSRLASLRVGSFAFFIKLLPETGDFSLTDLSRRLPR
jgi:hypothetical protein